MNKKYTKYCIIVFLIGLLDQLTKLYVVSNFKIKDYNQIIANVQILLTYNVDCVMGSYCASNEGINLFIFYLIEAIIWVIIGAVSIKLIIDLSKQREKIFHLIIINFLFILGGLLGNAIDKIFKKGVVDFIGIRFENSFPIFNIADVFILIGSVDLFILTMFLIVFYKKYEKKILK